MSRPESPYFKNAPLNPAALKIACGNCSLRELCLPAGLTPAELDRLDKLVNLRRTVRKNEARYRAGEILSSIYAVRTGFFKLRVTYRNGRDLVTGFSMAGETLGMDGIGHDNHNCDALAREDSEVCAMHFAQLEELSREVSGLQRNFHKVMSDEILRESSVILLRGVMRAEERVAAFLLNMSQRLAVRGYSPLQFHLRMTREEIGSYLALKLEMVCRSFSRFVADGLIEVEQKLVRMDNIDRLKAVYVHRAS